MADGDSVPAKMKWAQMQTREQSAAMKLCRVNGSADSIYVDYLQTISEDCGYPKHWVTLIRRERQECREVLKLILLILGPSWPQPTHFEATFGILVKTYTFGTPNP